MENQIIRQMYQHLLKEEAGVDKISRETKAEIEALLEEMKEKNAFREYERYRDELFLAASAAEENGFVRGFAYAFRIFAECIRE